MVPRRVLIVGTGALATLFSARFSAIGVKVTILGSWQEALDAFNQNGAQVEGEKAFPVHALRDPLLCDAFLWAFILVKSWQTEQVAKQLYSCLSEDGLAITLQNGLGNMDVLAGRLGVDRVVSGITTLGVSVTSPGVVRLSGSGTIWVEKHSKIESIVNILRESGFKVEMVEVITPYLWGKLVINAAINPLSAILRVNNGGLISDPQSLLILRRLVREADAVARSSGITLPFRDPEEAVIGVAEQTKENQSSMLRDVLRNAPTEVDSINGVIVRLGQERNIDVRLNRLVMRLVKEKSRHSSAELSDMVRLID